jgi:hypothetical protein
MNAYDLGYKVGRIVTRIFFVTSGVRTVVTGTGKFSKFAAIHKISNSDAGVVTNNVFECLQYID